MICRKFVKDLRCKVDVTEIKTKMEKRKDF